MLSQKAFEMQQSGNEMVGFGDDLVAPVIETRPVDTAAKAFEMQQSGNEMVGFGDDLVASGIETLPVDTAAVFELRQSGNGEEGLPPAHTKDGSLDRFGKSAVRGRTGGWKSGLVLLVSQGKVTIAFFVLEARIVLFTKYVMRQTNAEAESTFSLWMGTVYLCSLVGGFLSDYLGRYLISIYAQVFLTVGFVLLSASAHALLKPHRCGVIGKLCDPHAPVGVLIFYISIYLIALGNGACESVLATFAADQFDEEDPAEKQSKTSFGWYFVIASNIGRLISVALLVYTDSTGNWLPIFWISTGCVITALVFLLSQTRRYRRFKPSGNSFLRIAQVIMASRRNRNLQVPSRGEGLLYGGEWEIDGTRRKTDDLKFLDKAAINIPITQVEEVKCILRLLPVWLCTIWSSVVFLPMPSLFTEQGAAMDRTILHFQVPPVGMIAFDIISTSTLIVFYDKLIVPLHIKLTKTQSKTLAELQRIGTGFVIAVVTMLSAGLVEQRRLKYSDGSTKEMSSLHILWQIPQYTLMGASKAMVCVAEKEFFAAQTPDGLKSLEMILSFCCSALGGYMCHAILWVVTKITASNGKAGWVPPNLNDGHADRFFFLLAALTMLNLGLFVMYAYRYISITTQMRDGIEEMEEVAP